MLIVKSSYKLTLSNASDGFSVAAELSVTLPTA